MKNNKIIIFFIVLLGALLFNISVFASTTDAAISQMIKQSATSKSGASFDAPFVMPEGDIDTTNGAINMQVQDLVLPGKNGLDVVVTRYHHSYNPDDTFFYTVCDFKTFHKYIGVPYDVYKDGEKIRSIYIAYLSETDILTEAYTKENIIDGGSFDCFDVDEKGTSYLLQRYIFDTQNEERNIILKYDKYKKPVKLYKEDSDYGEKMNNSYNMDLYYGWYITVPHVREMWENYERTNTKTTREMYLTLQMDDGKKEIVKYEAIHYHESTPEYEIKNVELLNKNSEYEIEMFVETIEDERGFKYNVKLNNHEGKCYYFYLDDIMTAADGRITAITDKFDNVIKYETTGVSDNNDKVIITDTYGRKVTINYEGITVEAGDITKQISYSADKVVNTKMDPNEYYDAFHTYNFTVSEHVKDDDISPKRETIHSMEVAILDEGDTTPYHDKVYYHVKSVDYPTNCRREYVYEENAYALNCYANKDRGYDMHRVSGEKIYENGSLKSEKTFTYNGEWRKKPSKVELDEYKSFVTTEILPNNHTKETTLSFDSIDRLIGETMEYTDETGTINSEKIEYGYKDVLGALRRAPVSSIKTYQNGELISAEDLCYDSISRKILRNTKGETQSKYVYNSSYLVPTSVTAKQLDKNNLKQKNTLTSDKKNIAKTQMYEGSTLLRTIDYTYNTDGTLNSQSETNASGTVLTEYKYNYADDSSYTVTTTVKNVTDNDGNSKNVSTTSSYDSLGRLISQSDANLNVTRYEYDMLGRLTKQINPDNTTQEITYDIEENNLSAKDENNYVTTYDYSPTGNLEKVYLDADTSKVLTEYTYDALDRKTSETVYQDIGGTGTSNVYTYDDFDRVSTITTKYGDTVLDVATNTYDVYSNLVTIREGDEVDVSDYEKVELILDITSSYTEEICIKLDGTEVISEERTNSLVEDGYKLYDTFICILDVSDASLLKWVDKDGSSKGKIRPLTSDEDRNLAGGASQTVTTTYQGDENFVNPTKVAVMDGYGNVVSESYYDGEVAEDNLLNKNIYEYDYQGNVIKTLGGRTYMENLGDYTTKTEYDYMGNPLKEYRADGSYITNTYDKMGNLVSTTDYMGNTTTYTYDALSRVIKTTAPFEGSKTAETLTYYDNCGNIIKTKQQNNYIGGSPTYRTTEHLYDNRNRLTVTKANDGTQDIYTQYAYDGVGNVTQMITGQTERIYDLYGTLPDGATREIYEYDRFGNVIKTTDNEGRVETAEYNLIGKPTAETDKNGVTKYTLYNPYGSPAMVDKGSFVQMFEYTANNLLLSVGTSKEKLSNIIYTYDALGRVIKEHKMGNLQGTPVSEYTYDANGNRKSYTLTYNGSQVYSANYAYDNLDRLTTVSYNDMDVSDISYSYDANNRVVTESTTDNTATYTYNSAGLVTNLVNSNGADFRYLYNVDGNQYQMQSDRGEWIFYEYDGLGQLISEDGMSEYVSHYKTYTYDTRGNRISSESEDLKGQFTVSEYTYDSTNRLLTRKDTVGTAETNTRYEYDNNGNLILKHKEILTDAQTSGDEEIALYPPTADGDLSDDLVTTYTYNDFDELSGIETEDNSVSYLYDATGKRSLEIKNGNYGIMIWDGDYVVAETAKNTTADASKPIANTYFRGHKLFANKSANGVGYYTYDAHGSVIGMSGEKYVYDAFGNQITDTTSYNPFRYCGEYMEPDTGLIYLRNRYYDPSMGRFITEDPIKDGLNWYVYCGNNPVMFIDPLGLNYEDVISALNTLVSSKIKMNSNPVGSRSYSNAYQAAMSAKAKIRDDVIYIENWDGLRSTLSNIVDGDNNSVENLQTARNIVQEARDSYDAELFRDDVFFVGGLTAAGAPLIKGAGAAIATNLLPVAPTIGQISQQTQEHIMQEKHAWNKIVSNPNDWNEIKTIVMDVVKNGTESAYGSALQKTMQVKDQIVVVTYKIVDGVIRISDGWVRTK